MGKNEGKGLAHRVGLAQAGFSEVAVQKGLKDACNATGILSLYKEKQSHRYSEVEMCVCAVTVRVNSFREGCWSSVLWPRLGLR